MQSRLFFGLSFSMLLTSLKLFSITDASLDSLLEKIQKKEVITISSEVLTQEQALRLAHALLEAPSHFSEFAFVDISKLSEGTAGIIEFALKNPSLATLDLSGSFIDDASMNAIISHIKGDSLAFDTAALRAHSGISKLVLSKAQSTEENWFKLAKALRENKESRTIALCGISNESNELFCNKDMNTFLEQSFSKTKKLNLDLSNCGFTNEDTVQKLREKSYRSVTITYSFELPKKQDEETLTVSFQSEQGPNVLTIIYGLVNQFMQGPR